MCNTAKIYDFITWGVARVWKVYNRSWLLLINEFVSDTIIFCLISKYFTKHGNDHSIEHKNRKNPKESVIIHGS